MPSYSKQKMLSTYFVDRRFIESTEEYLLKEIPNILNINPEDNTGSTHHITIDLHDSHGIESYQSIKDYKLPQFRNDIDAVCIEYKVFASNKDLTIKLRLGTKEEKSDFSISLTDENVREKVSAIEQGVLSILNMNKTLNWLLYPNQFILAILVFGGIFCGLIALGEKTEKKDSFIYGSIFWAIVIYAFAFRYLKGYCSFDSLKQKQFDKWFSWLIMGIAGFIIFTTILPSIRKTIFGF